MWATVLKWLGFGFNVVKDSRTIQVGLMIAAMFFIDWRMDQKDKTITELKAEMQNVQSELALTRKEVENREVTTRIIEKHYIGETRTAAEADNIKDFIQSAPEEDNAILPPVTLDTNARLNCMLHPDRCEVEGDPPPDP
jgi:hypothetical protein